MASAPEAAPVQEVPAAEAPAAAPADATTGKQTIDPWSVSGAVRPSARMRL
jgi:hypothetical protein